MADNDSQDYLNAVLELYLQLPDTPAFFSDLDHEQAEQWLHHRVPFETIRSALLLGSYRRATRSTQLPPLPPIRSLRYFRPVLEELQAAPLRPKVAAYLRYKAEKLLGIGTATT